MICPRCGNNISFIHFVCEALNVFKCGRHECLGCGYKYLISLKIFIFYVFSVGIGRCIKYIYITLSVDYDQYAIISVLVIRVLFIYLCCVFQQIIYFMRNRKP